MNRRFPRCLVVACGLLLLALRVPAQAGTGEDSLSAALRALCAAHEIHAARWVLVERGQATLRGGWRAREDDRFRVGSVGKLVVAIGAMRLVEEGLLSLDGDVAAALPSLELDNPWGGTKPLRLAHLLEHSAGLDDMHYKDYFLSDDEAEGVAARWHGQRLRWPPGTCAAYSNVGYALVAEMMARGLAVDRVEPWLEGAVMAPIGMGRSYFDVGGQEPPDVVPGAVGDRLVPSPDYSIPTAVGLVSTAADLERLLLFMLGGEGAPGRGLLDSASRARMYRHATTALAGSQWWEGARGLGMSLWGLDSDPVGRVSGAVDGFRTEMVMMPRQGYGWIFVGTNAASQAAFSGEVTRLLDGRLPRQRALPEGKGGLPAVEPRSGHYALLSRRNELFALADYVDAGLELEEDDSGWVARLPDGGSLGLDVIDGSAQAWLGAKRQAANAWRGEDGATYLQVQGRYYVHDGDPWPARLRIALAWQRWLAWLGLLMLGVGIVGRVRQWGFAKAAWGLSLAAVLPPWSAWAGWELLEAAPAMQLAHVSLPSSLILLCSLLVPAGSLLGPLLLLRRDADGSRAARAWKAAHVPLILLNLGLAAYLVAFGLLPFGSWWY